MTSGTCHDYKNSNTQIFTSKALRIDLISAASSYLNKVILFLTVVHFVCHVETKTHLQPIMMTNCNEIWYSIQIPDNIKNKWFQAHL